MESFVCISLLKKLETGKTKGRIWGGRQRLWGLTQLCSCLSQSHEAIGSDVSFWDPLLSAPAQYSRCTQVACPPGGSRTSPPKSRIQSVKNTCVPTEEKNLGNESV